MLSMTPDKQPSKENAGIHVSWWHCPEINTPSNKMRTCNSTYNKCLEENSFKYIYHMHLPISEWAKDWNIRKQG